VTAIIIPFPKRPPARQCRKHGAVPFTNPDDNKNNLTFCTVCVRDHVMSHPHRFLSSGREPMFCPTCKLPTVPFGGEDICLGHEEDWDDHEEDWDDTDGDCYDEEEEHADR